MDLNGCFSYYFAWKESVSDWHLLRKMNKEQIKEKDDKKPNPFIQRKISFFVLLLIKSLWDI